MDKKPMMLLLLLLAGTAFAADGRAAIYYSGTMKIGQSADIGEFGIRLSDISVATGKSNVHPAIFDVVGPAGELYDQFQVIPGETYTYEFTEGKKVNVKVARVSPGPFLDSKWAETVIYSGASQIDAGKLNCEVYPSIETQSRRFSAASGQLLEFDVTIKANQNPLCGPIAYGLDFTNAYDGDSFALEVKNGGAPFSLAPGEARVFRAYAGVPASTAAKAHTLQLVAYPESDHWKQVTRNVIVDVAKPSRIGAKFELDGGWNLVGGFGLPLDFSKLEGSCKVLSGPWGYDPMTGLYSRQKVLSPGRGYWLLVENRCTLQE